MFSFVVGKVCNIIFSSTSPHQTVLRKNNITYINWRKFNLLQRYINLNVLRLNCNDEKIIIIFRILYNNIVFNMLDGLAEKTVETKVYKNTWKMRTSVL